MDEQLLNDLKQWITNNKLVATIKKNIVTCGDKNFLLLQFKNEKIINEKFQFIVSKEEFKNIDNVDFYLFKFGSFFYYSSIEKVEFKKFKYFGISNDELLDVELPFLGIHGKYEICNGSRSYFDWCKKAKFLGYTTLGLCEKNTLGGALYFQNACKDNGIKSIIGLTVSVSIQLQNKNTETNDIKIFAKTDQGWFNLLKILHEVTISELSSIKIDKLIELSEDVLIVLSASCTAIKQFQKSFENVFINFDTTEWSSNDIDKKSLLSLKNAYENYFDDLVIIPDAYYLDQEEYKIKPLLNEINRTNYEYNSSDQYFKSKTEIIMSLERLTSDEDKSFELFQKVTDNLSTIVNLCNCKIPTTGKHLPEYEQNEDELELELDNITLFLYYVEEGFEQLVVNKGKDIEKYRERLDREVSVLIEGEVSDYFLILSDIVRWCNSKDILTGIGRGSAAGCLVSYLLGITGLDPIEYNLLFERFLNKARLLGGSLPDIDQDVPSEYRQEIIQYVISKYGADQVACIGTAQNFKLKSTLKDMLKVNGVDFKYANYVTSFFGKEHDFSGIEAVFEVATKESKLYELINKHWEHIEMMDLCLFQPRSFGIHAAAIIIVPKYRDGERTHIWDYAPVRKHDATWVTEWEKEHVEQIGLLKEDILGLLQLDKLMRMKKLVKANTGESIDIVDIPVDDRGVYDLFAKGINEDIFQFGSSSQKVYCTELKPDTIHELIAANALYRPGAMENNSHNKYVKMKFGEMDAVYPKFLEDITSETFGLYVYQEQAMLSYQRITNCDLNEADKFRKVLTKLTPGVRNPDIEKYEQIFKDSYVKMGVDKKLASYVWDLIIGFSTYGFNKSHAASYALTGYYAQWFKCHHTLEFYVTALEFANDETISNVIHEINLHSSIKLKQPDINKSSTHFTFDEKLQEIYWSFTSIKFVGDGAVSTIIEERNKNGAYFSFDEFVLRTKTNKRCVENLIVSGAFDSIEKIDNAYERYELLKRYFTSIKRLDSLEKMVPQDMKHKNWWWQLFSKTMCGYGFINYKTLIKSNFGIDDYVDPEKLQLEQACGNYYVTAGLVTAIIKRNSKKGPFVQLNIDNNNSEMIFTVWNELYSQVKDELKEQKLIVFKAMLSYDSYKKKNTFKSDDNSFIEFV